VYIRLFKFARGLNKPIASHYLKYVGTRGGVITISVRCPEYGVKQFRKSTEKKLLLMCKTHWKTKLNSVSLFTIKKKFSTF
jgi:hypothetical protein